MNIDYDNDGSKMKDYVEPCYYCKGHIRAARIASEYIHPTGSVISHIACFEKAHPPNEINKSSPENSQLLTSLQASHAKQLSIAEKKNADYSRGEDEYRNFRMVNHVMPWISVEEGIIIRMLDKIARLANLAKYGNAYVTEESFEDTCDDTSNYSNILKAYRQNENKNNKPVPTDTENDLADQLFGMLSPEEKSYLITKLDQYRRDAEIVAQRKQKNGISPDRNSI